MEKKEMLAIEYEIKNIMDYASKDALPQPKLDQIMQLEQEKM